MQNVELSYLSGGLAWKADYVAELNGADTALDLNGWVTLTNTSGTAYPNAKLQLVAGDINRVRESCGSHREQMADRAEAARPRRWRRRRCSSITSTPRAPDDHRRQPDQAGRAAQRPGRAGREGARSPGQRLLLPLERRRHRAEDEGRRVRAAREPRVFAPRHADAEGRGARLQEGQRRQRAVRRRGSHRPHAEERDRAPKLGEAFDVTADKKQTDFKRREPTNRASYVFESAYEIVLRNAKKEAASVVVREPVPGDWTMLEETQRHAKVAAGTAEWRVHVPAEGSTTCATASWCATGNSGRSSNGCGPSPEPGLLN